jgi:multidrug resistance efflux pump
MITEEDHLLRSGSALSPMDVRRPPARRRPALLVAVLAMAAVIGATVALSRMDPAPPVIDRDSVWLDVVRRGEMVRDVEGVGTLVPQDVRLIAASAPAVVMRVLVAPGALVSAHTRLAELDSPELALLALDAERELGAAAAALAALRAATNDARLSQASVVATLRSDVEDAKLRAAADEALHARGYLSTLEQRTTASRAEQLGARLVLEDERRRALTGDAASAVAAQQAQVARLREIAALRSRALDALVVRAGVDGVLVALPLEVGQRVFAGDLLAKVARPDHLKAELRIAEAQAQDVAVGQRARIDAHTSVVEGRVSRIAPVVRGGSVVVDVEISAALPDGARPDMGITGVIEIERLANVLFVGRPASAATGGRASLFKLAPDGASALRTDVQLGRAAARTIEVTAGLNEGEQVILSDLSRVRDDAARLVLE